ncbi:hypothetical protein AB6A23_16665 [Paenibacillus tarimensis]
MDVCRAAEQHWSEVPVYSVKVEMHEVRTDGFGEAGIFGYGETKLLTIRRPSGPKHFR